MTRQEAIKVLRKTDKECFSEEYCQAIEKAVYALEILPDLSEIIERLGKYIKENDDNA